MDSQLMSDGTISNRPIVAIEGVDLPNDVTAALGPCWVESSVNLPAAFHLTFRMSERRLIQKSPSLLRIGARVQVYAVAAGQGRNTPLITGVVTAVETEHQDGIAYTVLRGLDHSFKMMRHRRATAYLNQTDAEIVTVLAGRDGVEIGDIEPTAGRPEVTTQPNISDWQFVQYLAERNDMEADFDDEGLLRFRKPKPPLGEIAAVLKFGTNAQRCRIGITASDQVTHVVSRGWNVAEKTEVLGAAAALDSSCYQIGTSPATVAGAFGDAVLVETGTPYDSQAEANRAAGSLAEDVASAFAELEVEVRGNPALKPGAVVALEDAGPTFDGLYTVSTTRHVFGGGNDYMTWVWVTGRQVRTLYGLASGGIQQAPRIPGVVNAIVTDINDPLEQGRVKVRFPWFADYSTDWVRTVQFGGTGGGGVISPEVEDEVLVAFDRGSLDHPYVLGGLYSNPQNSPSKHETPLQTGGRLNRRSLVSRSGQRLELLDARTRTGVRLRSGDEALTVFLDESHTKITITSTGTIEIGGAKEVRLNSDTSLDLAAPKVNITGAVNITGDVSITGALSQKAGPTSLIGPAVSVVAADVNVVGVVTITGATAVNGGPITNDGQIVMLVPS